MDALRTLMNASVDELKAIDGIGPVTAQSIYDYFDNPENRAMVEELLAVGVRPTIVETHMRVSK